MLTSDPPPTESQTFDYVRLDSLVATDVKIMGMIMDNTSVNRKVQCLVTYFYFPYLKLVAIPSNLSLNCYGVQDFLHHVVPSIPREGFPSQLSSFLS